MSIVNRIDNRTYKENIKRENRQINTDEIIENIKTRNTNNTKIKSKNNKRNTRRKSNIREFVINHIAGNLKEYFLVIVIFLIGILLGVIFINNVNDGQAQDIQIYINNFLEAIKGDYTINSYQLLKTSLIDYLKLVISMWFIGSTVIGMPIVLGIVLFRGFCIGYTVAAGIAVLGTQKGIMFFVATIFLQNIIFIPVLLVLAVSGINLYKSIMKDKRKENIKLEILRHTLCSVISYIALILASVIESYISTNLLVVCSSFF